MDDESQGVRPSHRRVALPVADEGLQSDSFGASLETTRGIQEDENHRARHSSTQVRAEHMSGTAISVSWADRGTKRYFPKGQETVPDASGGSVALATPPAIGSARDERAMRQSEEISRE